MKIGLQINYFNWPSGGAELAPTLARIAGTADEVGFDYISVLDHFFPTGLGERKTDEEMLEAYTALGFLAAHTKRAKLLTLVTGAIYRQPGILAKIVTTLDVLSGGRAILGIGTGWHEEECVALGLNFPSTSERYDHLEDALEVALRMWSDDDSPYVGKLTTLQRPMNVPQALSRPHPPIMVGGGGERKTLRYVAKYAQMCNMGSGPDLAHKLEVLREHCQREGRDYDEIEKTVYYRFDTGKDGERADQIVAELKDLADLGVDTAIGGVVNMHEITPLEIIGRDVIPAAAKF